MPLRPAVAAALAFLAMLSSTLLIPAMRPFFAAVHPDAESGLFLFMSVNMGGAIIGAPLVTAVADATGARRQLLVAMALLDGVLLLLVSLPLPLHVVLVCRVLQGAANVATMSLLMGMTTERGVPVAGAATVLAVAAGAPFGTLLLPFGPEIPMRVGAVLPVVVAVAVVLLRPGTMPRATRRPSLTDVLAVAPASIFIFAERLAIGLFIVPFSLLCHEVRGFDDRTTGALYAAFLVPFAVATALWLRLSLTPVVSVVVGALVYAAGLVASARVDGVATVAIVLVVAGCGAACVYAPALKSTAQLLPSDRRSAGMGVVNAIGSFGMFLGSGMAGAITRAAKHDGVDRAAALTKSFDTGAIALVVLTAIGVPLLIRALRNAPRAGASNTDA